MSAYDVVVLAYTPTLSHLTRPLALAGRLRRWGRRVVFAGQGSNKRLIEAEGFEVAPIFEPDAGPLYNNIRRGKLRFVEASTLKRMVSADLELFRSLNPSVVLTDGRFSAPISAQLAGIKHAAIVNASSTAYRADPYVPMLTNFSFLKRSYGQPFVDLMKRINLKLEMSVFDNTMRIFKNLSKFYGLEKEVTATNCLTGADLTLLADLPEYFPTKDLPEDYHYIGPLTWTTGQAVSRPSWWPPAAENRHLLYFTMGTTGVPEFFKVVDEIFSKGRFSAVVTTGGQQAEIKSRPPRLYVADYIDGDRMMQMCDLVVCHGGNGTVYQALKHGKAVIGIPTLPDQAFNMRRVEALGLGRSMALSDLVDKPDKLLDLIEQVLNEELIADNVALFREKISSWESIRLGAGYIAKLLDS